MREIKFRAWETWDGEPAKMVYFDIYSSKTIEELATNAVIMQYTGLKDINGREIYEGDILRGELSNTLGRQNEEVVLKVKWDKSGYWTYENMEHKFTGGYLTDVTDVEVIGNIYENLELLTAHSKEEA